MLKIHWKDVNSFPHWSSYIVFSCEITYSCCLQLQFYCRSSTFPQTPLCLLATLTALRRENLSSSGCLQATQIGPFWTGTALVETICGRPTVPSAHSELIAVCSPHRASADCVWFPPEPLPPPSELVLWQECQDVSVFGESDEAGRKRASVQQKPQTDSEACRRAKTPSSPLAEVNTLD